MMVFTQPNIVLSELIEGYISFTDDGELNTKQDYYTAVPDPFTSVIFNYGTPLTIVNVGGKPESEKLKGSFVTGFFTSTIKVYGDNLKSMVVVVFKPTGINHFININVGEMTNKAVPLAYILGNEIVELEEKLREYKTIDQKIEIIEQYFFSILKKNKIDHQSIQMANLIMQNEGNISISELSDHFNYNKKYLAAKFKNSIGISPKLFSRIVRFKNLISHINMGDLSWVQKALESGYYDQAHFIKDFKEFSGMTPEEYVQNLPNYKYEQVFNELMAKYMNNST